MKTTPNIKNYFFISILGLIILGIMIFAGRPLLTASLSSYKDFKDKKTELADLDKNISNLKSLSSEVESINYTIAKATAFTPAEENLPDFIIQLEAAAKKSDLTITKIDMGEDKSGSQSQTSQPTSGSETSGQQSDTEKQNASTSQQKTKIIDIPGVQETVINVEAAGSYPNLISFLKKMRQLARFNIIKNLSIDASTKDTTIDKFMVIIFTKS